MDEIKENDDNVVKIDMNNLKPQDEQEDVTKVDFSKPPVVEEEQEKVDAEVDETTENDSEVVEEVEQKEEVVEDELPTLEEVTEEETEEPNEVTEDLVEEVEEAIAEAEATGEPLPENIQKLIDFMDETGGSLEDYVNLNRDYSDLDNLTALTEYYKRTKPHLTAEEVSFLIEDSFDFDEEVDDERDIKRKKLALKEQVASARPT